MICAGALYQQRPKRESWERAADRWLENCTGSQNRHGTNVLSAETYFYIELDAGIRVASVQRNVPGAER